MVRDAQLSWHPGLGERYGRDVTLKQDGGDGNPFSTSPVAFNMVVYIKIHNQQYPPDRLYGRWDPNKMPRGNQHLYPARPTTVGGSPTNPAHKTDYGLWEPQQSGLNKAGLPLSRPTLRSGTLQRSPHSRGGQEAIMAYSLFFRPPYPLFSQQP